MGPDTLEVTPEQEEILIRNGYEMDSWRGGELLVVNDKQVLRKSAKGRWRPPVPADRDA